MKSELKRKPDRFKLRMAGRPALEPPRPRPLPDEHPATLLFGGSPAAEASPEPPPAASSEPLAHANAGGGVVAAPPAAEVISGGGAAAREGVAAGEAGRARRKSRGGGGAVTFEDFKARWGLLLRSGGRTGKLDICRVVYEKTHAAGKETLFISYVQLGKLAGLRKATTVKNIKQLEEMGFIERLNIYNTATRKGTELCLHLVPLEPSERKKPVLYLYDE